jgi:hypothetical protein
MATAPPPPAGEEHVYLTGHASLQEYLAFRTTEPLDAPGLDLARAADEWRAAHDYLQTLQYFEAVWADNPPVQPVPRALEPLVAHVHSDPIFRRSFALVPAEVGVVELDRLVVRHRTLNLAHVRRVQERLGPAPDAEAVFRLCMPFDHPAEEHRVGRAPGGGFVFTAASNNFRFLEAVLLRPGQVADFAPVGPVAGVVGLFVGFGSNYLNALASDGRLVLNNGHHRACALRERGLSHVPCVIQRLTRREELNVVAAGHLRSNPDAYLKVSRPPVLKDYFDPKLRTIVRMVPVKKQVKVTFTVEESEVPE